MDEIGRGTSTFDGLSLAWACGASHRAEDRRIHAVRDALLRADRAAPTRCPSCANVHLDATEHGDELVFLHAVKPGPASQSYGLQVARAGGRAARRRRARARLPAPAREASADAVAREPAVRAASSTRPPRRRRPRSNARCSRRSRRSTSTRSRRAPRSSCSTSCTRARNSDPSCSIEEPARETVCFRRRLVQRAGLVGAPPKKRRRPERAG